MDSQSKAWSAFSLLAALFAAAVARKGLNTVWRLSTGKEPPTNAGDPDIDIGEAVAWAVLSGVIVGLARMLATRRAAKFYAHKTDAPESDLPAHA
jgi:hypothetical protein